VWIPAVLFLVDRAMDAADGPVEAWHAENLEPGVSKANQPVSAE
jgi:hypothetical protein